MKKTQKVLALILAAALLLAMGMTAFADVAATNVSGPGTLTITNAQKDIKYTLYQIFSGEINSANAIHYVLMPGKTDLKATVSGAEVDASDATGGKGWFTIDASTGLISATSALTETVLRNTDFINWAKAYGKQVTPIEQSVSADGELKFTNLPYGYYLVDNNHTAQGSSTPILTIDSVHPNAVVRDKNRVPTWKEYGKSILKLDCQDANPASHAHTDACYKKVQYSSPNLDEDIPFDIEVNAMNSNGPEKVYRYEVTDVIDRALTYKGTSFALVKSGIQVRVKVGTTTTNLTEGTDYTIQFYTNEGLTAEYDETATGAKTSDIRGFRITIPWTTDGTKDTDPKFGENALLNIRYTGFMDSTKVDGSASYQGAPNVNKAQFKFWDEGDDPDDPEGKSTIVSTHNLEAVLEITKEDGNNTALKGAEFTLTGEKKPLTWVEGTRFELYTGAAGQVEAQYTYWKLNNGTYTTTSPATANINTQMYETPNTPYKKYKEVEYAGVQSGDATNATAKSFVKAVGSGSNLKYVADFSALGEGTYKIEETVVPSGYNKADDIEFKLIYDPANQSAPWRVEDTDNDPNTTSPVSVTTSGSGATAKVTLSVTVKNQNGTELPSTGGIGTTIFYAAGSVLLLGAAVLLITRRRMRTEK